MDPHNIPFNTLIVGPTNSGKTQFLMNQLCRAFRSKFDYVVPICPTFAHNRTLYRFAERDPHLYVIICEQHEVEECLKAASLLFEGTNTLIILDDCASSKEVKGRTGELVKLGFSARHSGISVWVLTQQLSSIAKPFRENVAAIVLFYTPSAKTTKAIFEEYAGELSHNELRQTIARLKERRLAHLVFSLCHPFEIQLKGSSTYASMDQKKFQGAEHIFGWREMEPGYWYFIDKEVRGMNMWQKPIAVVTVKLKLGGPSIKFYAPPSLHFGLDSRPETAVILYENMAESKSGFQYPKFKYAS